LDALDLAVTRKKAEERNYSDYMKEKKPETYEEIAEQEDKLAV
jgi:hypothetical protein